jgi:hypothetical protein
MLYGQIRIGLASWIPIRNILKSFIRIRIETIADLQHWNGLADLEHWNGPPHFANQRPSHPVNYQLG